MKDIYSQEQYQKFLDRKKEKKEEGQSDSAQSSIDEEIKRRAEELEAENYDVAKQARMKLEASGTQQKDTTGRLKSQGEKLRNIKGEAIEVHEGAVKGAKITKDIKREGKLFGFHVPLIGKIKHLFSSDRKIEKEVEVEKERLKHKKNRSTERIQEISSDDEQFNQNSDDEVVKGEGMTNKELYKISNKLKGMNSEAEIQKSELKKQKGDIKKISKVNENSEQIMDRTTEELKKV
ncbi:hypothetical protein LUQ84_002273 [Hamiltosporidium tvaerminnensis]|nr:hypothetical protein LUQ84_002273 [Hamiltosporidium tvaerminnensis]